MTEGLFRLPGTNTEVQELRQKLNDGQFLCLAQCTNIHSIASLIKLYFRELPIPLCTFECYDMFVIADGVPIEDCRLDCLKKVLSFIPENNLALLAKLCLFLNEVSQFSDVNRMTPQNLAIVFTPNLLVSYQSSVAPKPVSSGGGGGGGESSSSNGGGGGGMTMTKKRDPKSMMSELVSAQKVICSFIEHSDFFFVSRHKSYSLYCSSADEEEEELVEEEQVDDEESENASENEESENDMNDDNDKNEEDMNENESAADDVVGTDDYSFIENSDQTTYSDDTMTTNTITTTTPTTIPCEETTIATAEHDAVSHLKKANKRGRRISLLINRLKLEESTRPDVENHEDNEQVNDETVSLVTNPSTENTVQSDDNNDVSNTNNSVNVERKKRQNIVSIADEINGSSVQEITLQMQRIARKLGHSAVDLSNRRFTIA